MAGNKQKLKLLYLIKIFTEDTDDQHALTLPQIAEKLDAYGVSAERKTLYQDFELLRDFGFDIIGQQARRNFYYHMGNRRFELPELKLLVDSVQSAKFITDKKSNALIKKLEGMVSKYEARKLQRQVIISGRIKAMNESIYYNVDKLHEAIGTDRQIRFKYFRWNINKEMELRKDGAWYQVSPWALMWDDENYYLVGYDAEDGKIKHYRVDKMRNVDVTDIKRKGKTEFNRQDKAKYNELYFRMYGGDVKTVTLLCKNEMANVIIDQFGKDVTLRPVDDEHFTVSVAVVVSSQFLSWVIALEGNVKVKSPEDVKEQMKDLLNKQFTD